MLETLQFLLKTHFYHHKIQKFPILYPLKIVNNFFGAEIKKSRRKKIHL